MNLSNEVLFYGGIAVIVIAFILAIIFVSVYKINRIRITTQLEVEYGKK